ncbi:MAG: ATP-binding protein, partial [Candidatus Accumulibacter sp.]|nr:ATP-binding protein [Accumulibacter sp.]
MTWPVTRKLFNIAGPCDPARHYMVPAIPRLPEATNMVEDGLYFILHAARQSGKTTLIRGLTREINAEGQFCALYCSLEALQGFDDPDDAIWRIADLFGTALRCSPVPEMSGLRLEPEEHGAVSL